MVILTLNDRNPQTIYLISEWSLFSPITEIPEIGEVLGPGLQTLNEQLPAWFICLSICLHTGFLKDCRVAPIQQLECTHPLVPARKARIFPFVAVWKFSPLLYWPSLDHMSIPLLINYFPIYRNTEIKIILWEEILVTYFIVPLAFLVKWRLEKLLFILGLINITWPGWSVRRLHF